MTRKSVVVDTNVLVVANGRETNVSLHCQLACVEALTAARDRQIVHVDTLGRLLSEYQTYTNFSGSPGVGDMFFRYLFDNQYLEDSVRRVSITPSDDGTRGYVELPANALKAGDRVVLATAVQAAATVVNATDSDWVEQANLLATLEVPVDQVCPDYAGAAA